MPTVKFEASDDIIDICMDNVFKAVFTKDNPQSRGALEKLISCLIMRNISVITIAANEPPIDSLRDRQIRFDISCKTETGEPINIEMTMYPDDFEPVRLEYYSGKLFTSQDIRGKGKTFDDLKPSYQITFLVTKSFFSDDEIIHNFEYYDPKNKVSLGGRSRIIMVELNKLDKIIDKPVERMTAAEHWSVFFKYITDTTKRQKINEILKLEEGIAMASEVLISISRDEVERARLLSEYKGEVDYQSKMVQAERTGQAKGLAKGLATGLTKGRTEGRTETTEEFLALLKAGKPPEEIIQMYDKN